MKALYEKSRLGFALLWIGIYALGGSLFEELSRRIGVESLAPALYFAMLSGVAYWWIKRHHRLSFFGLCRPTAKTKAFLWFIPLVLITLSNGYLGMRMLYSPLGTVCFVVKMLCVGFLEELIFRGFLFRALCCYNIKFAMAISSISFGVGHILNLFNGSGTPLWENVLQIVGATAFGFLYVILFARGGSLLPCMLSHGIFNGLSAFSIRSTVRGETVHQLVLVFVVIGYTLVLCKSLPKETLPSEGEGA